MNQVYNVAVGERTTLNDLYAELRRLARAEFPASCGTPSPLIAIFAPATCATARRTSARRRGVSAMRRRIASRTVLPRRFRGIALFQKRLLSWSEHIKHFEIIGYSFVREIFIHPLAEVSSSTIGRGTRIWQFVVVLKGAVIGEDCNICSHCFIERDVIIGNRVTVKCGVQLWDGLRIATTSLSGQTPPSRMISCPREPEP